MSAFGHVFAGKPGGACGAYIGGNPSESSSYCTGRAFGHLPAPAEWSVPPHLVEAVALDLVRLTPYRLPDRMKDRTDLARQNAREILRTLTDLKALR